jgi:putative transposase
MANTYTQIFYHVVFAVRNRNAVLHPPVNVEVYKYISGIIEKQNQKLFIINGMPDHVHLLINCKPDINLSNLVKEIKEHSTRFINDNKLVPAKFYWQAGFGAFTVAKRDIAHVIAYIKNQEEHHRSITFRKEYIEFLVENDIQYKDQYLFNFDLE